jgi:HD-GYP domain-containing protein (c-di-GMP phosphodiesterase class II)
MRVPNEILNKPARLTDREFELMKSHVPVGVDILEKSKGIPAASIEVARSHHERFDGSGYAIGSRSDQIGLFGQIGSIVDFYDAITSDRAYHSGVSAHDALRKLYGLRGTEFDPTMAEQFIQCMGIYPIGSLVELNTGGVGVVISVNRDRRLKPCVALVLNSDKRPFDRQRKILDLMHQPDSAPHSPIEIKTVLPSGTYGINPVQHLPFGSRGA